MDFRSLSAIALTALTALASVQTSRACPFCYEGRTSGDLFCTGLHEWKEGKVSYGWYWEWTDSWSGDWYYHGIDGYDWYDGGLMPLGVWSPVAPDVPEQSNPMPAQATSRDPVNLLAGRVMCLVEDGHVLADVGADGGPLRVYVRTEGVDGWLGFVDLTGDAPRGRWFVADATGSVRAVVDDGGGMIERYDCDAWGRVLRIEGADGVPRARSAVGNRIVWQGREWFPASSLYFFRERWYDPVVGRWVSEDPVGLAGGLNLYEFCGGDPVNDRDPFGLARIGVRGCGGLTLLRHWWQLESTIHGHGRPLSSTWDHTTSTFSLRMACRRVMWAILKRGFSLMIPPILDDTILDFGDMTMT